MFYFLVCELADFPCFSTTKWKVRKDFMCDACVHTCCLHYNFVIIFSGKFIYYVQLDMHLKCFILT